MSLFRLRMANWRRGRGKGFGIWSLGRQSIRDGWLRRFKGRRCRLAGSGNGDIGSRVEDGLRMGVDSGRRVVASKAEQGVMRRDGDVRHWKRHM